MTYSLLTGQAVRDAARDNIRLPSTSGVAPGYLQVNLMILPSRYAADFRNLCARNPVPCPLIAESAAVGKYDAVTSYIKGLQGHQVLPNGCDIRTEAPLYMVYKDSKLDKAHCSDIRAEWTEDHVAFLIGCSYSFEHELSDAGLTPRHTLLERNVPMYRTKLALCPAGVFTGGTYVVSMRPYKKQDIEKVRDITRKYGQTHGEPIAWGWEALEALGIADIDVPDWGDVPVSMDGKPLSQARTDGSEDAVPVFWGCGVTPQEAVMRANLEGTVMAHAPGHMLVLDALNKDVVE